MELIQTRNSRQWKESFDVKDLSNLDLYSLIKRNDWNTRYLSSTQAAGYWNVFDSRFTYPGHSINELVYDDYSLKSGKGAVPSYSDGTFSLNISPPNVESGGFAFCTKKTWVSQFECDFKISSVRSGTYEKMFKLELYPYGSQNFDCGMYYYVDGVLKFTGSNGTFYWDGSSVVHNIPISDYNWHHAKVILAKPIIMRFFNFQIANASMQFKNFKMLGYIDE